MSTRHRLLSLLFGLVGLAPGVALAQFFYDVSNVTVGTVVCTTTGVSADLGGNISYNLPSNSPNFIFNFSVNGAPQAPFTDFITPVSDTIPAAAISITLSPAISLPYTLEGNGFPLLGQQPVGTGFHVSVTCPAGAPGTLELSPAVAPNAVGVPLMPPPWLLALIVMLGWLGIRSVARRRSRPR